MALEVEWYDFVCFGIVGVALIGALWVLGKKEAVSRRQYDTRYESLLVARPDSEVDATSSLPKGHVSSSQLWTSCLRELNPLWLLATRFTSFLVMAVLLIWDSVKYSATIFYYYTDFSSKALKRSMAYGYWLQWQVPACAIILIVSVTISVFHILKAKAEPLSHKALWIPRLRNLNPMWLFLHRAFAFLCLARIQFIIVSSGGAFPFYFYTQWTFTLVTIYFALASVVSAHGCWHNLKPEHEAEADYLRRDLEESMSSKTATFKGKETWGSMKLQSRYAEEEFLQRAGFWGYLMQIIYQICGGAVIITDIVFWCVIVPFLSIAHLKLSPLMGCMHTLNIAFLLVDTALNNLPFPWFRMAYFVLWSCAYIIFLWIARACGLSWWPYPFLELDIPWAPLWYFFLAVFHIPCYLLYVLIVRAKHKILAKLFQDAFLRP